MIHFSFQLYKKNFLSNLILVFQFTLSIIIVNIMIGHINLLSLSTALFEPLSRIDGGIYMPIAEENSLQLEENMKPVASLHTIDQYIVYYQGHEIPMFAYDSDIIQLFSPHLTAGGIWLDEGTSDAVPIVILKNSFGISPGKSYEIIDHLNNVATVFVFGQFSSPAFLLNLDFTSNHATPNHLYRFYDSYYSGYPVIATTKEAISKTSLSKVATQHSTIVFFEHPITENERTNFLNYIESKGFFTTFAEISEQGKTYQGEILLQFIPYFVCAISVSLIGLLGLTILSLLQNMKTISVFHLLGNPWRSCSRICFQNSVITAFLSLMIVVAIIYLSNYITPLAAQGIVLQFNNILFTVLIYALFLLVSFTVPCAFFSKKSSIQLLKKSVKM